MRKAAAAFLVACVPQVAAQWHPFGKAEVVRGSRSFPGQVITRDLDFDGTKDLLVANAFGFDVLRGPASAYLLDATYKLRNEVDLPTTGEPGLVGQVAITTADFDGDRLPELVTFSEKASVAVLSYDGLTVDNGFGKPRFKLRQKATLLNVGRNRNLSISGLRIHGLVTADLDGKPPVELVYTADLVSFFEIVSSSGITLLGFDRTGKLSIDRVLSSGRYIDLAAGDIDGDGDTDLAALGLANKLLVLRNDGTGKFTASTHGVGRPAGLSRLSLSDLDGDGRADFIAASSKNGLQLLILRGTKSGTPGTGVSVPLPRNAKTTIEGLAAADFDLDGRRDLAVLLGSDLKNSSVLFLKNKGKLSFAAAAVVALPGRLSSNKTPVFVEPLRAADLNGDLAPELVVGSLNDPALDRMVQVVLPNKTPSSAGVVRVGTGVAGSAGLVPRVSVFSGRPVLGDESFAIGLSYALGGRAWAALHLSPRRVPLKLYGLTWQSFPSFVFAVRTRGSGAGGGLAWVPMAIPKDPRLPGLLWYMQWVVFDPGAANPLGLALSRSLRVRVSGRAP